MIQFFFYNFFYSRFSEWHRSRTLLSCIYILVPKKKIVIMWTTKNIDQDCLVYMEHTYNTQILLFQFIVAN